MKRHKLLIFEIMSRRIRWKLFALWLILLITAVYDLYSSILGDYWILLWIAIPALIFFWFYYAFIVPRAWLIIKPEHLILQVPFRKIKISYDHINNIISTQMAEHYSLKELKRDERNMAKPNFRQTCSFLELNRFPEALEKQKRNLPRILFSSRKKGLLLAVQNWLQLNRDVESAKTKWLNLQQKPTSQEDDRSLAARILDL